MKRMKSLLFLLLVCLALAVPSMAADSEFEISQNGVLLAYNGSGGDVVIPASVKRIGPSVFERCADLTSITIPNSVISIGDYAFSHCTGLTRIDIPNSVTSIDYRAFWGCSNLTSITIPNSVVSIGESAFGFCTGLTRIDIPNSVTSLGDAMFWGCSGLTSFTIPNSITSISEHLFWDCSSLTSVTIPDSVTFINEGAFSGCASLTNVTIPESMTSISDSVFSGCKSLTNVTISDCVTSIGGWAFANCESLTSIKIPDSVTNIGSFAFDGCTSLSDIYIPPTLTSFGQSVFSYTPWAEAQGDFVIVNHVLLEYIGDLMRKHIIIPDSVKIIGDSALSSKAMAKVTIPDSVTTIDDRAFDSCLFLTEVSIPSSVTNIAGSAFDYTPWLKAQGDFPIVNGTLLTYLGDGGDVKIPDSVTKIADYAFYYYDSGYMIVHFFPDSTITDSDFEKDGCHEITSITIPDSVTSIGDYAFKYCDKLTNTYYGGSEQQWKSIRIGKENATLLNSRIHHSSGHHTPVPTPAPAPTPAPSHGNKTRFTDVFTNDYYYSAVEWAVTNNIAAGTSETTFSPNAPCTNSQILTLMWNIYNKPASNVSNCYTDVHHSDYYYKPALWAAEEKIIPGTTFAPNTPCTRANTVLFLWRAAGCPRYSSSIDHFTDVPADAEYAGALAWALDCGFIAGTSETTFSPDSICTRGQIVTILQKVKMISCHI